MAGTHKRRSSATETMSTSIPYILLSSVQVSTSFGGPYPFANLIGLYGPTTGRKLLLCAHWDTRPVADEDPDPANRSKPIAASSRGTL